MAGDRAKLNRMKRAQANFRTNARLTRREVAVANVREAIGNEMSARDLAAAENISLIRAREVVDFSNRAGITGSPTLRAINARSRSGNPVGLTPPRTTPTRVRQRTELESLFQRAGRIGN